MSFSEAGSVERQVLDLWNMPLAFLLLLLLKAGEWLVRLVLGAAVSERSPRRTLVVALGACGGRRTPSSTT